MTTSTLRKVVEANGFELVLDSTGFCVTSLATGLVAWGYTQADCYKAFSAYRRKGI